MPRKKTNSESANKDTIMENINTNDKVNVNDNVNDKVNNNRNANDDKNVDFHLDLFTTKKKDSVPAKKVKKNINENTKSEEKKELKSNQDVKTTTTTMNLNQILTDDDKLLFSLNIIGSIQKNEKLIEKDDLISIDDRWFFQSIRRWWSEDSREKSSNKILIIISETEKRLLLLLDEYYKPINFDIANNKSDKTYKTENEKKRLINKYFLALNKAKIGLENCRETYPDQFTKNKFSLSIQKTEDLLNKLQNYEGVI